MKMLYMKDTQYNGTYINIGKQWDYRPGNVNGECHWVVHYSIKATIHYYPYLYVYIMVMFYIFKLFNIHVPHFAFSLDFVHVLDVARFVMLYHMHDLLFTKLKG